MADLTPNPSIEEIFQQRQQYERQLKIKRYRELNAHARKGQTLFTGSSLMEQFPVDELCRSFQIDTCVYNRGVGGFTTDDFLREIDTQLLDLEPSKIFINIGTNDIKNDPAIPDGIQPGPALPCFQRTANRFRLSGGRHSAAKDGALHDLDDHAGIFTLDPAVIHNQCVILQLCGHVIRPGIRDDLMLIR